MKITRSTKFKRDYKLAKKQRKDLNLLIEAIRKLANKEKLAPKYHDHKLSGPLKKYRELHLHSNWLLIYRINEKEDELLLARLGSHSELFK